LEHSRRRDKKDQEGEGRSRSREDVPRIMRRGNIFGSREPVNKVDSSGGSFSSLKSEGGVKEVPLRQEKKENVKHTLDGERLGGSAG